MKTRPKAKLAHVLLRPNVEYGAPNTGVAKRLVADGTFGARPPLMYHSPSCGHPAHRRWFDPEDRSLNYHYDCYMCRDPEFALVLGGDGAVVLEGIDRARRVLTSLPSLGLAERVRLQHLEEDVRALVDIHAETAATGGVDEHAIVLEHLRTIVAPLGSIVLVDADGEEVSS